MIDRAFLRAGHAPTLFAAFFYFDISFMVWVLLGPLGVQIAAELHLNAAQKGLMVAVPILAGALLRVVNGILVDRIGPKRTGTLGQSIVLAGLIIAWLHGVHSYAEVLVLGIVLGVAGSAFAIALPLASRWYPPEHQGTALGIAGAGNSGTVFAALFAPSLAAAFGWINVIGMAAIPIAIAFAVYLFAAKESPNRPSAKSWAEYLMVLRLGDAWWFMFFYGVTFGGFSGLPRRWRSTSTASMACRPSPPATLRPRAFLPDRWCGRWVGSSRTTSAAFGRCRSCMWSPPSP